MTSLNTPGVYIQEKNAFPNSMHAVETAVPVFIGYTQCAEAKGASALYRPTRITSFAEYVEFFGSGFVSKFDVVEKPPEADEAGIDEALKTKRKGLREQIDENPESYIKVGKKNWYVLLKDKNTAYMYNSIRLFYANGGSVCYIISVGVYGNAEIVDIKPEEIASEKVFNLLEKEYEPTLVVAPDLIAKGEEAYSSYALILAHCEKVQSRFAIFDVDRPPANDSSKTADLVLKFRESIGIDALKYGAAYYPWLHTQIVSANEISLANLDLPLEELKNLLPDTEKDAKAILAKFETTYNPYEYFSAVFELDSKLASNVKECREYIGAKEALSRFAQDDSKLAEKEQKSKDVEQKFRSFAINYPPLSIEELNAVIAKADANLTKTKNALAAAEEKLKTDKTPVDTGLIKEVAAAEQLLKIVSQPQPSQLKESFLKALKAASPTYVSILEKVRHQLNILPPSGAMAGIYTMVDNTRGVWKAPANVSVNMVIEPSVNISHEEQEKLNIDILGGKSINVIRAFPGIGTLVWGGRTLDGNSLDWRYINVRRTLIMIEQSIKLATRAYVFEPNDINTWTTVKSMITNFLTNLWKQGALAGAAPEQAFDVQIGLGTTMTPTDVLEGKMLIGVKVAIVRPAEFIVITFQQQLQQS